MDTQLIATLASAERQCIGLTFDPTAPDPAEAWIATVGLDSIAAGSTAHEALHFALMDADGVAREIDSPDDGDDQLALPFTDEPDDVAPPEDDWRAAWSMRLA